MSSHTSTTSAPRSKMLRLLLQSIGLAALTGIAGINLLLPDVASIDNNVESTSTTPTLLLPSKETSIKSREKNQMVLPTLPPDIKQSSNNGLVAVSTLLFKEDSMSSNTKSCTNTAALPDNSYNINHFFDRINIFKHYSLTGIYCLVGLCLIIFLILVHRDKYKSLQKKVDTLEAEKKILDDYTSLQENYNSLQEKYTSLQKKVDTLEEENKDDKDELLNERDAVQDELVTVTREKTNALAKIDALEDDNRSLSKERDSLKVEYKSVLKRIQDLKKTIKSLSNERDGLKEENLGLSNNNTSLNDEKMKLSNENDAFRDQVARHQSLQADSGSRIEGLQTKNKSLQDKYNELSGIAESRIQELQKAESLIKSKEQDIEKLTNEKAGISEAAESSIKELRDELDTLHQMYQSSQDQNDESSTIKDLEVANQSLSEKFDEAQSRATALQADKEVLSKDKAKLSKELEEKNSIINALNNQINEMELEQINHDDGNVEPINNTAVLGSPFGPAGGNPVPLASPLAFAQGDTAATTTTTTTTALGSPLGSDGTSVLNVSDSVDGSQDGTEVPPARRNNTTSTTTMASPDSSEDSGFYFNDDIETSVDEGDFDDDDVATSTGGGDHNEEEEEDEEEEEEEESEEEEEGGDPRLRRGECGVECFICDFAKGFKSDTFRRKEMTIRDVEFQEDNPRWVSFDYEPPIEFRGIHAFKEVNKHLYEKHYDELIDEILSEEFDMIPVLFQYALVFRYKRIHNLI